MESNSNFEKSSSEDQSKKPPEEKEDREKITAEIKELEERLLDSKDLEKEEIIKKIGKLNMELGDDDRLKRLFQSELVDN
jgi:hypothetical protein